MSRFVLLGMVLMLVCPAMVCAQTDSDLAQRVESLEQAQAEIYHSLEGKKAAGGTQIGDYLEISALIELEAVVEGFKDTDGNTDSQSDLSVATAQLGIGASWDDHLAGTLTLLYEEDDSEFDVDEAFIVVGAGPVSLTAGRQYIPFGFYYSHLVTSPILQDLGESSETALTLQWSGEIIDVSLFGYNGDAEKATTSEDHLRDGGVSIDFSLGEIGSFGGSYLVDLADSDAELLFDELANPDNLYVSRVAGWSAYLILNLHGIEVSGEALGAVDSFSELDLDVDGDGEGDQPLAWNFEAAYHPSEAVEVSVRVEGSDEISEAPELQYGANASYGFHPHATLAVEYLFAEYEPKFSPGADIRHLGVIQLALEY